MAGQNITVLPLSKLDKIQITVGNDEFHYIVWQFSNITYG